MGFRVVARFGDSGTRAPVWRNLAMEEELAGVCSLRGAFLDEGRTRGRGSWIVVVREHSRWLLERLLAWWCLNDGEGGCAILDFLADFLTHGGRWFHGGEIVSKKKQWWREMEALWRSGDGANHGHESMFSLVVEGGGE
ncbi:uncharacterized protein HKW66_Vig0238990 [Vigna angularis]|uniref:Uncharacterized protein n=1 Tax=Phaseolus angularis TaxID=3914 RepID=A0A8T0KU81_PHAAN|nr:uncharacterized protein HKW66_Vig0238990 [Vigna angularis]